MCHVRCVSASPLLRRAQQRSGKLNNRVWIPGFSPSGTTYAAGTPPVPPIPVHQPDSLQEKGSLQGHSLDNRLSADFLLLFSGHRVMLQGLSQLFILLPWLRAINEAS